MSSNVYTKKDILEKLANDGFFVDYLTLDSFLSKYKVEAIFEDEEGNELFDKSAYETLVSNVINRTNEEEDKEYEAFKKEEEEEHIQTSPVEENGLSDIKWHDWQEVSADLIPNEEAAPDIEIISSMSIDEPEAQIEEIPDVSIEEPICEESEIIINEEKPQTQEDYWNVSELNLLEQEQEISQEENSPQEVEQTQEEVISEPASEIELNNEPVVEESVSNVVPVSIDEPLQTVEDAVKEENTEDDFDDIGLLSDSIQVQEKFQNYIVNELAKKNIDLTPKIENAFKLDVSEKTLNMIARAIAKKIARQVSIIFNQDSKNNQKAALIEQKNQQLEAKVNSLEEQNKKLKLLLVESNKNLNSYQPTIFGFYRFVKKKTSRKKK